MPVGAAAEQIARAARLLGAPLTPAVIGAGAKAASGSPNAIKFPKMGSPINDNRSREMKFTVEGPPCGPEGCTLSDRITVTPIVDPDSRRSRSSGQNILYFPDGGHYTEMNLENWVLCYGYDRVCATATETSTSPRVRTRTCGF